MPIARALAFSQFIIISLGAFILHLLVKVQSGAPQPEPVAGLAQFLARHALWLFAAPILYAAVGAAIENNSNRKSVQMVGVIITVILVLLLGFPIAYYLF